MSADRRVAEILTTFRGSDASAPWLLCDRHPGDATAFTTVAADLSTRDVTFAELAEQSQRVALALQLHGIRAGDRVATLMGRGPELPAIILGIWRLGAVYVPLFTAFAAGTIAERLESAHAKAVVTDDWQVSKVTDLGYQLLLAGRLGRQGQSTSPGNPGPFDLSAWIAGGDAILEESPGRGPSTPLVHMFTSGTTGKPKAVVHPLDYVAGWQSYFELGLGVTETSVFWCGADSGWAYGLYTGIVAPMASGFRSILNEGPFDPSLTWKILQWLRVTDFAAAPTALRALRSALPESVELSDLRHLSTAGEPLTPDVGEWTRAAFGIDVHDHYGQTELGMPIGFAHHDDIKIAPRDRAMGRAFPGWTTTVLNGSSEEPAKRHEVGRLAVATSSPLFTFTGYGVDRDIRGDRFTSDGSWYLTGDLVSVDDDGLIRFASRDDDVILMAGYRIGPFDVESVLSTHRSVRECAVVAEPDKVRGEVIHAFVVASDEVGPELTVELQQWVKDNYGAHAYPRRITYVEALPKTPSGKIQRNVLRMSLASPDMGVS